MVGPSIYNNLGERCDAPNKMRASITGLPLSAASANASSMARVVSSNAPRPFRARRCAVSYGETQQAAGRAKAKGVYSACVKTISASDLAFSFKRGGGLPTVDREGGALLQFGKPMRSKAK